MGTITAPAYVSREEVKAAADVAYTAFGDARVDRAIETATGDVDGLLLRRFAPWSGTRYFDWPNDTYAAPHRLWLNGNEVATVTALVSGGTTIPPTDYFLRRSDGLDEPPYTHIEINLGTSSGFSAAATRQRSTAVTGVFCGCPLTEAPAGTTAEVVDASETAVDVTDSAAVGVGHLIRVDSERMLVVDKTMLTTGQTLLTPLTAQANSQSATVADGTAFTVGETLLLDSERMLIQDIAGNTLTVRRAHDGTTLAAHTGSTVYAPRTLTVVRAAQGTAAAAHGSGAPVYRHVVPALVRDLALAYALNQREQEAAGYARTAGAGDHLIEVLGRGVKQIEADAERRWGRQARKRAV